jgi:hypothetical protein
MESWLHVVIRCWSGIVAFWCMKLSRKHEKTKTRKAYSAISHFRFFVMDSSGWRRAIAHLETSHSLPASPALSHTALFILDEGTTEILNISRSYVLCEIPTVRFHLLADGATFYRMFRRRFAGFIMYSGQGRATSHWRNGRGFAGLGAYGSKEPQISMR